MSDFMDTPEGSIGQLPERPSTILLIDDNPDIRQLLRNQLAPFYRILQAEDGLEGLHQITEASPDLILCDVMMGEMDGIELCRTIKSDPELNAIPIILLTARSSDHAVLEGLEAGADDYIIKPFHPKTLKAKIDNLIASRSRLRDQYSRSILLKPTDMEISSEDEVFLQELVDHISRHLDDADFSVAILADLMAMSRRQLERKVKSVCEKSPADLIRSLRMERASELLHAQAGSIADIAYQVGFRSPSHFTATFKSYFGEVPSEYVKDATKSI
jgi:DNA-binding response OmpR family regulator